jgi:hypothetical protein
MPQERSSDMSGSTGFTTPQPPHDANKEGVMLNEFHADFSSHKASSLWKYRCVSCFVTIRFFTLLMVAISSQMLREYAAEFFGVVVLTVFGTGVVSQVVLSSNTSVASSPKGVGALVVNLHDTSLIFM